jgi:TonB family protein
MTWLLALLMLAAGGPVDEAVVVAPGLAEQRIVHREPAAWPHAARLAGVRGVVRFSILVDEEGRVAAADLVSGHPLLVEAARAAVLRYRFRPLFAGGRAVRFRSMTGVAVPSTFSRPARTAKA